ncbi:hypothetical protein [Pseudomonas sp. H2_G03]
MDRQEQELKRFLEAQTRFSFADVGTAYTAKDFWTWAFSNMEVPVLRGVLIEYLVARHLIAHNDAIVGDTVRSLTTETPGPGDLTKSIERFYRQQPHGDVFDLQLTWGVTLEIKKHGVAKQLADQENQSLELYRGQKPQADRVSSTLLRPRPYGR